MNQVHLSLSRRLLGLGLLFAAASCGSGADVGTFGSGAPPLSPLAVDFGLRSDLVFGATQVSDAIPVDLNGDGRLDVVEANFLDGTIRVALRDALGGFSLTQVVPGNGGAVWRLGQGDVNSDGLVDIVAVEVMHAALPGSVPAVTAFLQDSPGTIGSTVSLPLGGNPVDLDVVPAVGSAGVGGGAVGGARIVVAETTAARVSLVGWNGLDLEVVETLDSTSLGLGKPLTVAAIDIGGDGVADLAVGEIEVTASQDRVIVYPADGIGGFEEPMLLALSAAPILDTVADVDGNGFEDLGVANLNADEGQVLTFDALGLLDIDSVDLPGGSSSIVFGDLNGDGRSDVAATILESQELVVLLQDASGSLSFDPPKIYNAGPLPRTVAAVELNDDGVLDLLCPSDEDVAVLIGDGSGGFRAARGYPVGEAPVLVQTADLDGDGDQDAITVDVYQRQFGFLENTDGQGTFVLAAEVPFSIPAETETPGGFAIGDLNNDTLPDVAIALHATAEVIVLWNPGTVAGFVAAENDVYQVGAGLYGVAIADVNGDTARDVVVSSSDDRTARILLNDPLDLGALQEKPSISLSFQPGAVVAEDFDGDGVRDLAFTGLADQVTEGGGLTPVLGVLGGDGLGNFIVEAVLPVDSFGASLSCGDFNGDGLCDLAAGQPMLSFDEVWVYMSTGSFGFEAQTVELGASPAAVTVADVNRDGALDLLVPTGGGELRLALGDGEGGFPVIEPPGAGGWPVPVGTSYSAFADVNGDGLPDLLMVSPDTPNLWTALNDSVEIPTM